MMIEMIRGVLFDFGGVLTYSCWDIKVMANLILEACMEHKISVKKNFHATFEQVMEDAWNRVIETLKEERLEDLIEEALIKAGINPSEDLVLDAYEKILDAPFCIIREDSEKTLQELKSLGLKLAIVSNAPINFHRRVLSRHNLEKYFDAIVVSCDVIYRKPHPRIYEIALQKIDVKPHEAIFVGDILEIDIVGAKELGLITVLMKTPEPYMLDRTIKPTKNIDPDFVIDNLYELVDIVKNLQRNSEEKK